MTAVISSVFPALPSHLGDSGMKNMATNYPTDMIAMPPSIQRQCGRIR